MSELKYTNFTKEKHDDLLQCILSQLEEGCIDISESGHGDRYESDEFKMLVNIVKDYYARKKDPVKVNVNEIKENFISVIMKDSDRFDYKPNQKVIEFISDFVISGETDEECVTRSNVLYKAFRCGYCWYFAHILKLAFNGGEVCWASPYGHFVWVYEGVPYDIDGVYVGEAEDFIPESFIGDAVNDFKHVRGLKFMATDKDIDSFIREWKESKNKEDNQNE